MDKRIVILTKSDFIRDQLKGMRVVNNLDQLPTNEKQTVIMVSYPDIIRTEHYPNAHFLNVHNSLLPKYRGLHAFTWALCHGEEEVGFTLHHVVNKVDAGKVVAQLPITVSPTDDINTLFEKAWAVFFPWFRNVVLELEKSGVPDGIAQDENQATYFPKRKPEDSRIDWKKPATTIHNLIRAVAPPYTPGAFFAMAEKKVCVAKSEVVRVASSAHQVGYLYQHQGHWQVVCGENELRLLEWNGENGELDALLQEGTLLS